MNNLVSNYFCYVKDENFVFLSILICLHGRLQIKLTKDRLTREKKNFYSKLQEYIEKYNLRKH